MSQRLLFAVKCSPRPACRCPCAVDLFFYFPPSRPINSSLTTVASQNKSQRLDQIILSTAVADIIHGPTQTRSRSTCCPSTTTSFGNRKELLSLPRKRTNTPSSARHFSSKSSMATDAQGPGSLGNKAAASDGMPNMVMPYEPQDPAVIAEMVRVLDEHTKGGAKGRFRIKKTKFAVTGSPSKVTVDSWKLQDWDYKKPGLPTYARGLFTTRLPNNVPEIAVRGYDKFFNVGEVPETNWENIIKNSKGPYELSLKENGCIIFISGLHDDTLLVCSKHSTGARGDIEISHANAGEKALDKQLAKIGKTRADLARELRERNATAIAELCDDSFEEHILAYGPDKAGLYLHGINVNQPYFMTYPGPAVNSFADDWGFKQTGLLIMDNIKEVKTFLEDVAETGAYGGRDVEGFVIRCKLKDRPNTDPGTYSDWFFKYKFEEPYLMYRQWRECTKALIAGHAPKIRKHKKITEEYLYYAKTRLAEDSSLAKAYNQNHGIIALRDDFLKYKNMKGSDAANLDRDVATNEPEPDNSVVGNVILVPIATIGCGKTTIAVALRTLFPEAFGHFQNDSITQKKGRPAIFTRNVLEQLKTKRVVIADRNNAWRRERTQILGDVKNMLPAAKLVALHFDHDNSMEVRKLTYERVFQRGDNHQNIKVQELGKAKVMDIMNGFLDGLEPYSAFSKPDADFSAAIGLNPLAGSRTNLEVVISKLHQFYPNLLPRVPTGEEMDKAIDTALAYDPKLEQLAVLPAAANNNKGGIEYMSIDIPSQAVLAALEDAFKDASPEVGRMYGYLKQQRRIQPAFHVTLMHKSGAKTSPENQELWTRYTQTLKVAHDDAKSKGIVFRAAETPSLGECDVQLERVVFDDRLMAIVVRIIDKDDKWKCINRVPHITIGTLDNTVPPKESNDMLALWIDGQQEARRGTIRETGIEGRPIVKGIVKAVLSKF
ncbi:tRNA ligase [Pyricularia oryzae 70-15]|uniref:tRNA ligase n=3 Tax=Pyricularia oryzae TaxID=318829 RepID=G4N4T4_PYRO7|nr:tRNA ligase [Pyricularia oryzae 70-15]EHA52899.1 tRNA ligase [Pyricularia oryzae 70-15]